MCQWGVTLWSELGQMKTAQRLADYCIPTGVGAMPPELKTELEGRHAGLFHKGQGFHK